MMQFPYFSSDKAGRPLQSLLGDPQDVLRKKSVQTCTFTLKTGEVFNREACTAVPPLCWCSRGSPWNMWLCLPSRRPWYLDGFFLVLWHRLGSYFWKTNRFFEFSTMKGKWKRKKIQTGTVWSPTFNWDVLWSRACKRKGKSWLTCIWVSQSSSCVSVSCRTRQETLGFVRLCCLFRWFPFALCKCFHAA